MEPPRFKFTLRSLMTAVAIVALMAWGCMLWHRSAEFAAEASEHGVRCSIHETNVTLIDFQRGRWYPGNLNAHDPRRILHEQWARYEDRMYRKYRRAAFLPWLPVSPDLPAPLDPWLDGPKKRTITKGHSPAWNWWWW